MAHEAGKGDAPRKSQDDKAYAEGYDRIFRKKQITHVAIISSGILYSLERPNRHHNIIHEFKLKFGDNVEGFLTDDGEFIDRRSAYVLAKKNGQLNRRQDTELFKYYQGDELYSEDLW